VIVWYDAEFPPAVDHGEEAEVVIWELFLGQGAKTELVEEIVAEKEFLFRGAIFTKDGFACGVDSVAELFTMPGKHEFEELGDGLGVLLDLLLCVGVQDGKAGVHMPFV
jgi:hypothetical protein